MNGVGEWAMTLCTVGVGCSILGSLCPKGNMRRVFGILTALVYFCCLISPLCTAFERIGDLLDLRFQEIHVSQELSDTVKQQMTQVIEEALTEDAKERLDGSGLTVKKVQIVGDISQTDSIYIERVNVTFDKTDFPIPKDVAVLLRQAWGTDVEVQYVGG